MFVPTENSLSCRDPVSPFMSGASLQEDYCYACALNGGVGAGVGSIVGLDLQLLCLGNEQISRMSIPGSKNPRKSTSQSLSKSPALSNPTIRAPPPQTP